MKDLMKCSACTVQADMGPFADVDADADLDYVAAATLMVEDVAMPACASWGAGGRTNGRTETVMGTLLL